jgi:hypothetical protein
MIGSDGRRSTVGLCQDSEAPVVFLASAGRRYNQLEETGRIVRNRFFARERMPAGTGLSFPIGVGFDGLVGGVRSMSNNPDNIPTAICCQVCFCTVRFL